MLREQILKLLREKDGFLSGQEISQQFGVSRTSIWKAIRQLEETGYEIEAVRNRGYRLLTEPDLLSAERIRQFLHTDWAGGDGRGQAISSEPFEIYAGIMFHGIIRTMPQYLSYSLIVYIIIDHGTGQGCPKCMRAALAFSRINP